MGCFDGLIGWKGGCEAPDGLLLDNVVRASEIEQFITKDYATVNEFIEEKLDFAIQNVVTEAVASYRHSFIPATIVENRRIGFMNETQTSVPAITGKMAGVELEVLNAASYFEIYISSVETYLQTTGNVTMSIVDTMTGQVLDTFTVASIAGQPVTTYVDKAYKAVKRKMRLGIVYNANAVGSYLTSLSDANDCQSCTGGAYRVGSYIAGRAISYPSTGAGILANIAGLSHTAGVSVIYNLRCDEDSWLCAHRNALKLPILYRTAEEILHFAYEMAKSERLNSKTNIDRDSLERRMSKAHEDYERHLSIQLKNIMPPDDGVCFVCRRTAKYVTTLP